MNGDVELRKVEIGSLVELVQILDSGDSWKKLMATIPNNNKEEYTHKYTNHHITLIESASKTRGSCTQILFEEWGTSGVKRPTLNHLLSLLVECELFRAADYVSVKLLNGLPVKRPEMGPGAAIDVSLDKLILEQSIKNMRMESLLHGMSYPNLTSSVMTTFQRNLDNVPIEHKYDKKFFTADLSNSQNVSTESSKSVALAPTNKLSDPWNESDLIKFSSSSISTNNNTSSSGIPAFSKLLSDEDTNLIPSTESENASISDIIQSKTDLSNGNNVETFNRNIQNHSFIIQTDQNDNISEPNIPNLSIMNVDSEVNIPNISLLQGNSEFLSRNSELLSRNSELLSRNSNIPDFGALRNSKSQQISNISIDYSSESFSSCNIPDISGLQNAYSKSEDVGINTTIPHFSYTKLQEATNNFEERQMCDENGKLISGKIGDGGFGSVYLSKTLLNIPVAIKKLIVDYSLSNANVEEKLLKEQFVVELETLTKCKHENVLNLLGYSYDGLNHCLISEFMENRSLRDNIGKNPKLTPSLRINIAQGIGRGLNYLHNAFETPLIHRDIKSANILLTSNYIPKICDFGLVKDKSSNHTTVTTKVVGTTAYMSPEAFRGDVSVKMDVFSLGVVLLELLTSLPSLDENRAGKDIVTHVDDICLDGKIDPLLDNSLGEWKCSDQLYDIAKLCLEEKRRRPVIEIIYEKLCAL